MSGGSPDAPEPSAQEKELRSLQVEQLKTQNRLREAIVPIIAQRMGLEPQTAPAEVENPEFQRLQERRDQLQQQLSRNSPKGDRVTQQNIQAELRQVEQQLENTPRTIESDDETVITGFEPTERQQELRERQQRIQELQLERQEKALKGELPVPSAITEKFQQQEEQLRSRLRDQLGPGFETSTPGIEALQEFESQKQLALDQARRGQLQQAQQLALNRQRAQGQRLQDFVRQASSLPGTAGGNNTFEQAIQGFRQQRADEFQFQQAQQRAQAQQTQQASQAGAAIGGALAGGFTGGLGAPAGAAIGSAAGGLLGSVF